MKKKICILGSTGSIGITTFKLIKNNKKKFNVFLLSTNKNIKRILYQSKELDVKNLIVTDKKKFNLLKKKLKNRHIRVFNNYDHFDKIFKGKIDYTMNAISGIDGLDPTLKIIKFTKKIAIANKESIICGWNLINKELKKNKTKFIPVDSEHFSIYELIKYKNHNSIKKIILTASGGPFLNRSIKKNISVNEALNHPNWKMGKKITIDSSTLMNKVFEVIEAKKIFNLKMKDIEILINPNSYIHAIVIFNNGIIKLLAHETKMDIPIYNSIYDETLMKIDYNTKKLNLLKFNNLNLSMPSVKKFKLLNILNSIPKNDSLFETILISVNDHLVNMFLNKKITFDKISYHLMKIINFKIFKKYYNIKPNSIKQILNVRNLSISITNDYFSKKN